MARIPIAPVRNSPPVMMKFSICTQPSDPLLSRLSWCLAGSKPARVAAWASPATVNNGPATAPQARAVVVLCVLMGTTPLSGCVREFRR